MPYPSESSMSLYDSESGFNSANDLNLQMDVAA